MSLDILQGFNLYADDVNKWLGLDKLKLPALEDEMVDFRPGAGTLETEICVGLKKLSMPFTLKTVDPQLLGLFGLGAAVKKKFTTYGYIVDEISGQEKQLIMTVRGRIMKAEQADLQAKEIADYDYAVGGIVYYHLSIGGKTIHKISARTNEQIVNGVEQNATRNRFLAVRGGGL